MRSSSSSLYQSGDTLHEIAYQRERPDKDFRVWLRELGLLERSEAYDLDDEEQRLWTALMVQAGRGLDRRLDELLHEVYETGDAFYDLQSRRRLKRLERELHECRRSVQHFENDVEEIALILSTETPISEDTLPAHFDTVELVLGHVKRKKIADGWVTATNILISFVILLVTVLWWLECFPR
jgi:hypothetical protein